MNGCYIVTFHTHYEALVCMRSLEKHEAVHAGAMVIKLIPVPRELSSSCGTAVKITIESDSTDFDTGFLTGIEYDELFSLGANGKYTSIQTLQT